jgi:hypothetical protein
MKHLFTPLIRLTFLLLTTAAALVLAQSPVTYMGTGLSSTQGAWTGVYGSDGYIIADYVNAAPSYAVLTPASSPYQPSGASLYPWTQQPGPRSYSPVSLQIAAGSSQGIASQIYSSTSFNINIALSGGKTRQIALYLLDFDTTTRAETITFLDGSTNQPLAAPQSFSSFNNGVWAIWQVQGSVTNLVIQVTNNNSNNNATISGIFFDTITSNSPAPPPNTLGPQVTVFTSSNQWVSQLLSGSTGSASATVNGAQGVSALGDYDGDGLVDAVTFLNGAFSVVQLSSTGASFPNPIGTAGDIAVPGDYDGDGKTDFAVFRPSTGSWYYAPSRSNGSPVQIQTSALSTDVPVPGDYDGDGITDIVSYRSSNAVFYYTLSTAPDSPQYLLLGIPGDVAIPGDYDGDGITDFALFRPSNGIWYYRLSTNQTVVRAQPSPGTQSGDVPVPGDYDGDGKTDFAIWRPSTQTWYVILSSNLTQTLTIPATASSSAATPVGLTPFTKARAASLAVHQTPGSYYTISGEICLTTGPVNNQIVCPAQGTSQLTGVTVTLGGSSSQQMLTDSNGSYSFTVPANGTYTVTPSLSGYTFAAATTPNLSNLMGNPLVSFLATAIAISTPQTISFSAISAQTIGAGLSLSASANSGLAVTFSSSTVSVCSVSGTTASFIAAGICTITASQAGNGTYAAAPPVSQSFTVNAAQPSTYQITGRVVLNGTNSGLQNFTLTLSNGQSTTSQADGSYSFTVSAGTYTITASYPGLSAVCTLSAPQTVSVPGSGSSNTTFTATFNASGTPTVFIDLPSPNVTYGDTINFSGWAADPATPISSVAIAIDGAAIGNAYYGTARNDVCSTAGGHAGNPGCPNVGWALLVDLGSLPGGPHTVTATATTIDGRSSSTSTSFNVPNVQTLVDVDLPMSGTFYSGAQIFSGWAIDPLAAISSVAIAIDGVSFGNANYGNSRTYVCMVVADYPGCPNVGWSIPVDLALLSSGQHMLTVTATTSAGQQTSASITFDVNPASTVLHVEVPSPGTTYTGPISPDGWAYDTAYPISSIGLTLDGVSQGNAFYGGDRSDACIGVASPGCPNVGWYLGAPIDTSALTPGSHSLGVTATTSDGRTTSQTIQFNVQASQTVQNVEAPLANSTIATSTLFGGWAYDSGYPIASVAVLIDGASAGNAAYGNSRPDVCTAGQHPGCPNVGWSFSPSAVTPGSHTFSVTITTTDGRNLTTTPFTIFVTGPDSTATPTKEYIYLNGKPIAIENHP